MAEQDAPRIMLPMPKDFDIRDLPRAQKPLTQQARKTENYRVESYSAPCGEPQDINRMLNGRLGEDGRKELNRILKTCRTGETIDMDIYSDGTIEVGPKGLGKFRITGRF